MQQRTASVLGEAFVILQRDQPAAFYRMARELDDLTVHLQIDGERFTAGFAADRPHIVDPAPDERGVAEVSTSRRTVLDLCDGRIRLLDAIMARKLAVRANEERLLRMRRAVTAFSEGAVRARRMRELLERFRAGLPGD